MLRIRVTVSAGTYIRALARDLGEALGCGGHLDALRRVGSGTFLVGDSAKLGASPDELQGALIPLDQVPLGLPCVTIDEPNVSRFRSGVAIPWVLEDGSERPSEPDATGESWVRVLGPGGGLTALARLEREAPAPGLPAPLGVLRLQPRIVL